MAEVHDMEEELIDSFAVITPLETKGKKSKKGKKKKNQVYTIRTSAVMGKGLEMVAAKDLMAGEQVLVDEPFGFIVRIKYVNDYCHGCLKKMERVAFSCGSCAFVKACSKECYDTLMKLHAYECEFLSKPNLVDVEIDLLRFVLRIVSNLLSLPNQESDAAWKSLMALVSHVEDMKPDWIKSVSLGFEVMLQVLTSTKSSLDKIVESGHIMLENGSGALGLLLSIASRINSNAHGLGDFEGLNANIGCGLFPNASRINHSCFPNCNFIGTTFGKLRLQTISPVSNGDELTVRYVDLYQTREARRLDLYNQKHFWCDCFRCKEPLEVSQDNFIGGILCENAACKKKQINLSAVSGIFIPKHVLNVIELDNQTFYACSFCALKRSEEDVQSQLKEAANELQVALEARSLHGNKKKSRQLLEEFLVHFENRLHPCQEFIVSSLTPLVNLCAFFEDFADAIRYAKKLVAAFDVVYTYPANYPETADFLFYIAELCTKYLNGIATSLDQKKPATVVLLKRYSKERQESLMRALAIRKIAYGEDHESTRATCAYMNSLR